MKTLRLILGDQLNQQHSWFQEKNSKITYVLMEIRQETDYVKHHIQKVVAFFLAMRSFADFLKNGGHQVIYLKLDNPENQQSLPKNLNKIIQEQQFEKFEYLLPDEYRLDEQLKNFCQSVAISSSFQDTEHFLTERTFLSNFFKGKKTYLLESFYRQMRKQYDILMEDGKPFTGKWNYDTENRKKYDPKIPIPKQPSFKKDVSELVKMIEKNGVETIGNIDEKNFDWATTREEGLQALDFFAKNLLTNFGAFQDAMQDNAPFLFHSRLSFLMNAKILSPLEVVKTTIQHWQENQESISYAQIEGFVRQIIGWREYMRGVYWAKMPEYALKNYLEHQNQLPEFYWTGKTKMHCLKQAIQQSLDFSYAHHIQRLMITGNFTLLAGVNPDEVDVWYLGIYIDAIEWVEITNTRGMSQFADGGLVGTKPYVSSANYINKMSSYCKKCFYNKKEKYGERACPFNSLYWHFYYRHQEKLGKNNRISLAYRNLEKMEEDEKKKILFQAEKYLSEINSL